MKKRERGGIFMTQIYVSHIRGKMNTKRDIKFNKTKKGHFFCRRFDKQKVFWAEALA